MVKNGAHGSSKVKVFVIQRKTQRSISHMSETKDKHLDDLHYCWANIQRTDETNMELHNLVCSY